MNTEAQRARNKRKRDKLKANKIAKGLITPPPVPKVAKQHNRMVHTCEKALSMPFKDIEVIGSLNWNVLVDGRMVSPALSLAKPRGGSEQSFYIISFPLLWVEASTFSPAHGSFHEFEIVINSEGYGVTIQSRNTKTHESGKCKPCDVSSGWGKNVHLTRKETKLCQKDQDMLLRIQTLVQCWNYQDSCSPLKMVERVWRMLMCQ